MTTITNSNRVNYNLDLAPEFKPVTKCRKRLTMSEIEEPIFLGANSTGILIKVRIRKYPFRLWMLGILPAIVWIFIGIMLVMHRVNSVKEDFDKPSTRFSTYWRVAGAIIKLRSSFLGFLLILVPFSFRNWEFRDILTNRRRKFTEWIDASS